MQTFEELGLAPELVEALAAEGIETPTAFQREALPVVRRGNSLLGVAGPGAGTLLAYGAALLDRFEAGGGLPRGVVVTPTADAADRSARSLAPLARATGHRVAALGAHWALPERADLLFASPDALLVAIRDSRIKLDALEAFVVDGAAAIEELQGLEGLETIFGFLPAGGQRVVLTLPLTAAVSDLADGHLRKSVRVEASAGGAEAPARGDLRYVITGEEKGDGILEVVAALLGEEDARHVVLYCRTDDLAADVGDFLGLHGFEASAPGDADAPVWLAVDEQEARAALKETPAGEEIATVSCDLPADADSLDRRHGAGGERVVLVLSRELPHLRAVAAEAGYRLLPGPASRPVGIEADLASFRERIGQALEEEDLTPHLLLLEPLFRERAPAEVAAALAALLRRSGRMPAAAADAVESVATPAHQATPARAPAWVHLFVSLGSKDGIGPGDLVGAVTGEAGVAGSQVGKVEIRDTFSRVEVEESVARRVIQALNGVTVRGRSVRVDYDRKEARPRGREAKGATRPGPRQRRSQARDRDRPEGSDGK
jgi:ATP-dependent RNA helicase DeaD